MSHDANGIDARRMLRSTDGVLFDTAGGSAQADGTLRAAGVSSRCATVTRGEERTRAELETLLEANGFSVTGITALPPSGLCLIEATAS